MGEEAAARAKQATGARTCFVIARSCELGAGKLSPRDAKELEKDAGAGTCFPTTVNR